MVLVLGQLLKLWHVHENAQGPWDLSLGSTSTSEAFRSNTIGRHEG